MARILVADDDPLVISSLVRFLRRLDHEVREVVNGREALEAIEESSFDLVITDINMPEVDGIEVISRLRESRPGLPVIAMSGGGLVDKRVLLSDADAFGAVSTIEKPFDLAEMRSAIDDALGR